MDLPPYKEEIVTKGNLEIIVRGRFVDIEVEVEEIEIPEIPEDETRDEW